MFRSVFISWLSFLVFLSYSPNLKAETAPTPTAKVTLQDLSIFNARVPEAQFDETLAHARAEKLHKHKKWAHHTTGLMLLTAALGVWGKKEIDDEREKRNGVKSTDDAKKLTPHMFMAFTTLASYGTTAYYSLSAPRPDNMQDEPARIWHKRLAYIHGPAMLLSPFIGMLAFKKYHDGQDPSGIAKLHRPIMWTGFAAYMAAFSTMTFTF